MSSQEHKEKASSVEINFSILTVSDTRDLSSDKSGTFLKNAIAGAGHYLIDHKVVKDEPTEILDFINEASSKSNLIITTGGTGISTRDTTVDAVLSVLEVEVPGFGELFRALSYEEIGSAAILSRSTAGIFNETLIFCLPGSLNAVTLAANKIIIPEIRHLIWELLYK